MIDVFFAGKLPPRLIEARFPGAAYRAATWFAATTLMLLANGCAPGSSEPRLVPAKALERQSESRVRSGAELPPRILKQIAQALETYYGAPSEPRFYEPAKEGAKDAETEAPSAGGASAHSTNESETTSESGSGDESQKKIKRVAQVKAETLKRGLAVFTQRCAACHGASGNGEGPVAAYLRPRPRDYRLGIFKFTSTPYGSKPRRADLIRTVMRGAKGTSMPSFALLEEGELQAVVDYVIMLSQRGEVEQNLFAEGESFDPQDQADNFAPEDIAAIVTRIAESWRSAQHQQVIPLTPEPAYDEASIAKGREIFMSNECFKCHGTDGRGRTPEPIGKDTWTGEPVYAADLSSGMLHGGRRSIDIYRRIYSGINGTPMPTFAAKFADNPEAIWRLVHFISSVTEGRQFSAASSSGASGSGTSPAADAAQQPSGAPQTSSPKSSETPPAETSPASPAASPAGEAPKP